MTSHRHGVTVGIERVGRRYYLYLTARGTLEHEDYEIINPMLESALYGIRQPSIDALIDVRELKGWEARAAWDDLKLGLKHNNSFARIAVVGEKSWQKLLGKVGGWFVAGEVKTFETEAEAVAWLGLES